MESGGGDVNRHLSVITLQTYTMIKLTETGTFQAMMEQADPAVREAITAAICTRGPRKGWALATCPPMGTPGNAGWQAIMRVWNPYKVSFCAAFFGDRELTDRCVEALRSLGPNVIRAATIDRDRAQLDPVW